MRAGDKGLDGLATFMIEVIAFRSSLDAISIFDHPSPDYCSQKIGTRHKRINMLYLG